MRAVHIADVHLDTLYAGRESAVRDNLRAASRRAFRAAVDLALAEEVDAFLIAGDLFDSERLSFETERFILGEARRLAEAGITVVYATGNHDPGGAGFRLHQLDWPEQVVIVRGPEPQRIPIPGRHGRKVGYVTAAGHDTATETRDLAATFPKPPGKLPEVALLHTQVVGARAATRHERYAPSQLSLLRGSGYDYWALGHVHLPQCLSEDPPIWYAGCPQGTNPRETGQRGCLLVDMSDRRNPQVRLEPLGNIRWESLTVDGLEEARSMDELATLIQRAWTQQIETGTAPRSEWLLRVELVGPCGLHRELKEEENRNLLQEELVDSLGLLGAEVRVAGVQPPVDVAAHGERQDVLGEAIRLLRRAEEDAAVRAAIRPDQLAAEPDGAREEAADAYIQELLDGLPGELVARLRTDRMDRGGGS